MVLLPDHLVKQIKAKDASFWVANASKDLVPDLVRANGVIIAEEKDQLTFFISEKYGKIFQSNCISNIEISFLFASILTLESYQLKGEYLGHRSCTEAEINYQKDYLKALCSVFTDLRLDGEGFFLSFFRQPTTAYTMNIKEIFVQTPKKGTGGKLNLNIL